MERATRLDIPYQTAAFHMVEIAKRLRNFLRGFDVVLTHAFEGGHPDHDAVGLRYTRLAQATLGRTLSADHRDAVLSRIS
jgi:LmbE family N-acetylglucosaminyl deacetylase